jgi:predicted Fe-Mo cluster-binding NifX family protein
MKVALTVWDGHVSPVFDVSREALIFTARDGTVAARVHQNIGTPTADLKIDLLLTLGVETLICGAISEPLSRELSSRGVMVLGFVAGDIEEVVQAFIAGRLPAPALAMPGCCGRQHRFQRGAGQGHGQGRGRAEGQQRKGR